MLFIYQFEKWGVAMSQKYLNSNLSPPEDQAIHIGLFVLIIRNSFNFGLISKLGGAYVESY